MQYLYLLSLIVALGGLFAVDYRWRLAYFVDRRATLTTIAIGVIFFSFWDIAGITYGVFFTGSTAFLSGVNLLPEYPLEEAFFLTLLSYNVILAWQGGVRLCSRT